MARSRIPAPLRRRAIRRAEGVCEYCLFPEALSDVGFEIDHVIAVKHLGPTMLANLAYACVFCNVAKGSDVGSIHWPSGEFVRFFNPRSDHWWEHFRLTHSRIEGLTPIGLVTARILEFNRAKRLKERRLLIKAGLYPDVTGYDRMTPR
jgi:hypothetical protein